MSSFHELFVGVSMTRAMDPRPVHAVILRLGSHNAAALTCRLISDGGEVNLQDMI